MLGVTNEKHHKVNLGSRENFSASDPDSIMDCSLNIASDTMSTGCVKDFKTTDQVNTEMFQESDKEILSKSDDLPQSQDNQKLNSVSRSP